MKCPHCTEPDMKRRQTDYHYVDSGLKNIYLKNVAIMVCDECAEEEIVLPNLEQLHEMIAKDLAQQTDRLRPEEIRFLRVHLGFSGADFAKAISVSPETVSRWENDAEHKMQPATEKLVRLMILAKIGPFRDYDALLSFGTKERKTPLKRQFAASASGWKEAA